MILGMSFTGEIMPIAQRMIREGQDVKVYVHSPSHAHNFKGIVPTVGLGGLKAEFKKADLVIFDITRPNKKKPQDLALLKLFGCKASLPSVFGPVADKMRQNCQVIGTSAWCEDAELDRMYGYEIAEKLGIKVPESHEFKNFNDGGKFLEANQERKWILKPQGNSGFTYLESWPGEILAKFSGEWKRRGVENFPFILQAVIKGVEISTEAWFDGRDFRNFNHTLEEKTWLSGEWGEHIGSQNNVVWLKHDMSGLLVKEFERLKPILRKAGYVGPIDINSIVDAGDKKPKFLEFSPRMGYDAVYCLLSLLETPISNFFYSGFRGTWKNQFVASQRITIKPFPYANPSLLKEFAYGVDIKNNINTPWFWMEDITTDKDGSLIVAGADGIVGVVTSVANSVEAAVKECYARIHRLKIGAKLQVRNDLGGRALRHIPRLREWGLNVD